MEPADGNTSGAGMHIKGASDFDKCLAALGESDLLRGRTGDCEPAPPCPVNGVNLPPFSGDFVAVSEFWYAGRKPPRDAVLHWHRAGPVQNTDPCQGWCCRPPHLPVSRAW